jgi:hypothetical protein
VRAGGLRLREEGQGVIAQIDHRDVQVAPCGETVGDPSGGYLAKAPGAGAPMMTAMRIMTGFVLSSSTKISRGGITG